jgi:hypothetical protein
LVTPSFTSGITTVTRFPVCLRSFLSVNGDQQVHHSSDRTLPPGGALLSQIGKKDGHGASASSKKNTTERASAGEKARRAGHKNLSKTQKNKLRRDRWAARKAQHQTSPPEAAAQVGQRSNQ